MPTFSEAVEASGRAALCAVLAANESVNALISPIAGDSGGLYPLTAGLRRKVCSDDPANDPQAEPDFTGGQCVGQTYDITWTQVRPGFPDFPDGTRRPGPISISRALNPGENDLGCPEGLSFKRFTLKSGGTNVGMTSGCGVTIADVNVTPFPPGPDLCGDPPPPPPGPPGDITYEGDDITYNIDGDTTVTVPISFIFSPAFINIDGSVRVPIKIDVGGVNFNGNITVSPEFNIEFNPSGITGGPGTVDDPDGIGEPGEPVEPVDPPEEGELAIIGVLVYSDIDATGAPTGILFPGAPNIYAPRVASVTFAVLAGQLVGWTPDQDVKNLVCYVPCLAPQGAIAVRVSPMPGVESRFTPVRGIPLTSFE